MASKKRVKHSPRFRWIRIISLLALIVSGYLTYLHFSPSESTFCQFGESFDCGIVNKSPYANLDGIFYFMVFDLGWDVPLPDFPIPVAVMGFVTFLFVILSVTRIERKKSLWGMTPKVQLNLLKWLFILSILFALYLVYIETFILLAYCLYCIILDVLILITTVLVFGIKT